MLDNLYPDVVLLAGGGQGAVLLPRGGLGRSRSGENRRQPARLAGGRSGQSAARRIIKGSLKANFQAAPSILIHPSLAAHRVHVHLILAPAAQNLKLIAAAAFADVKLRLGDDAAVGYAERRLRRLHRGDVALPRHFGQIIRPGRRRNAQQQRQHAAFVHRFARGFQLLDFSPQPAHGGFALLRRFFRRLLQFLFAVGV